MVTGDAQLTTDAGSPVSASPGNACFARCQPDRTCENRIRACYSTVPLLGQATGININGDIH
jgi:hypothetical protein